MNYASVLSNLKKAITPFLSVASGVTIQQTRNTFILKRKYDLPLLEKGGKIKKWKHRYFIYDLVENRNLRKKEHIDIILTTFVEGLGVRGDKLTMHPYKAYDKFLVTGLAVYATPENIKTYQEDVSVPQQIYSSPYTPQTIRYLSEFLLEIIMSAEHPWTLTSEDVRFAFREKMIHMNKDSITLPKRPINGPDLEMENKELYVTVTINQKEKVNVRCRIRYRSKNPNKLLSDPEAHLKESEPIYPEFKAVLDTIPMHSQLKKKLQDNSSSNNKK